MTEKFVNTNIAKFQWPSVMFPAVLKSENIIGSKSGSFSMFLCQKWEVTQFITRETSQEMVVPNKEDELEVDIESGNHFCHFRIRKIKF